MDDALTNSVVEQAIKYVLDTGRSAEVWARLGGADGRFAVWIPQRLSDRIRFTNGYLMLTIHPKSRPDRNAV